LLWHVVWAYLRLEGSGGKREVGEVDGAAVGVEDSGAVTEDVKAAGARGWRRPWRNQISRRQARGDPLEPSVIAAFRNGVESR
jgi:hypothetical protein